MKNAVTLLLLVVLMFNACKKKDDKNSNHFLTGRWQIKSLVRYKILPVDTTIQVYLFDCEKDNYLTFNSDGTYSSNEGALKCDPDDPQIYSGHWSLTENNTKLSLKAPDFNYTFGVSKPDNSTLELSFVYEYKMDEVLYKENQVTTYTQ